MNWWNVGRRSKMIKVKGDNFLETDANGNM